MGSAPALLAELRGAEPLVSLQRDRQDPGEHGQLQEEQVDHRGPAAQVGAALRDVPASCPRSPKPSLPRPWGSSRLGAFLQCRRVPARLSLPGSEAESRRVLEAAPRLGRLKVALAKKTGRPESEITGLDDGRRRRSSRLTEEPSLELEEEEESRGRKSRRDEEVRMWPPGTGSGLGQPSGISSRSCQCLPDGSLASPRPTRPPPASPSSSGRSRSWPRCAGGGGATARPVPRVPRCQSLRSLTARALPAAADVLPQEAAPLLADAAGGLAGPGPVPAPVLGAASPGRDLCGGCRR